MSGFAAAELVIARHGQAHCNVDKIIAGPGCTGLTDLGQQQALALARHLAAGPVSAVYSSTTPRAQQTAHIIGAALGVSVFEDPALRVPDPGTAEGMTWAAARRAGTDASNPVRPVTDGTEPWQAYLQRCATRLQHVMDGLASGRVVVVGHSETVTAAFALLLGVTSLGTMKVTVGYAATTTFRRAREYEGVPVSRPRWELINHNDASHLAGV